MACIAGKDGVVKVGATAIGGIKDWSIEVAVDTLDCSQMGTTWRTYTPSIQGFSGSLSMNWDDADAGQTALALGSILSLVLYPEGEGAGSAELTGDVIVSGFTRNASYDGLVEASVSFQGTGALTEGTV